jgi:hypothetical protein
MKRAICLLLLLTSLVFAADGDIELTQEEALSAPIQIIEGRTRLTKRVLFLIDVSQSMDINASQAISALNAIVEQPIDDLEIACISFDHRATRWPVESDGRTPANWAALPAENVLPELNDWLSERHRGGATYLVEALELALSEQRRELTLFVISDTEWTEGVETVSNLINRKQRIRGDLGEAAIYFYGIGRINRACMRDLCARTGASYFLDPPPQRTEPMLIIPWTPPR